MLIFSNSLPVDPNHVLWRPEPLTPDISRELLSMMQRIDWPRSKLETYRRNALRQFFNFVKERSKWHAERLSELESDDLPELNLSHIPSMNKMDLTNHFDDIVTDPRLSRKRCQAFLTEEETGNDCYLENDYKVTTSGGSTHSPTLVVQSRKEILLNALSGIRFIMRWAERTSSWIDPPMIAAVTSTARRFISAQVFRAIPSKETHVFSVVQPMEELVTRLNHVNPTLLFVYPSLLPLLAYEARRGRLTIRPKLIVAGGEPLLPEHEAAVTETWMCPLMNGWGNVEVGSLAISSGFDKGMLLFEDQAIVEPVDRNGKSVGIGERAEKLYVTSLYRYTLPLIRYEVTDQLTFLNEIPSCYPGFRRISHVHSRLDDAFTYPSGIKFHPEVLQSLFSHKSNILQYQVKQTFNGVEIRIVTGGPIDLIGLEAAIAYKLRGCGMQNPDVHIKKVPSIDRTWPAQKLLRFSPLRRNA